MVNPVVTRTETSGEVSLKTPLLFAETSMGMNVGGRSSRFLRILTGVAMRCWAIAGAAVLTCLLLYWAYGGLLAFMLLCFATTGILYHTEDNLLFHPELPAHSRVFVPVPSMFGLPYENIFVHSGDGTMLHLFYIRQQPANVAANAPTIIFLHGNAGNMGHRLQNTLGLYQNLQCNILMLEYRGYGLSQGSPSEEGLCMDARAALDYLASRQDVNHKEIILFGRSLGCYYDGFATHKDILELLLAGDEAAPNMEYRLLLQPPLTLGQTLLDGGAVAIDVASRPEYSSKIWCVVLENTFTSIPDMAKVLIGWRLVNYLPLCFYKNKFLSASKISCLERPTLFISGLADTLVPPRMMTELHRCCSSHHKQLLQFESGTHNETWTISGYYHAFANFLRDVRMRSTLPESPPSQVKPV